MSSALLPPFPEPGFSFENVERNVSLVKKGFKPPKFTSTGTTVAAAIFDGGIIIGTDKRASAGTIVANKNTNKIHKISNNIAFGGAGTAADCDQMEKMVRAHVELHRLNSGKQVPVCVALTKITQHLFRYQGHIQCALIVGGVDKFGYHLHHVYPHGSSSEVLFEAMGSGSLAAISHLELNYKQNMNLDEAKLLIRNAILAGVENDLASGNGIDLCIITPSGMEHLVDYEIPVACTPLSKQGIYKFPLGTTPILDSRITYEVEETIVRELDPDRFMETS
ncbi:proteasome subunit beta type-7-A [Tetranychus urticae]|uniref:proteasome subunit beta type-7-A n=1 Tax=Tetranychus urticae TaxID=32264 RepID=UPI00077BAC37|nr:proteasome subunit beta type-7-A [Tetranychus urticae]